MYILVFCPNFPLYFWQKITGLLFKVFGTMCVARIWKKQPQGLSGNTGGMGEDAGILERDPEMAEGLVRREWGILQLRPAVDAMPVDAEDHVHRGIGHPELAIAELSQLLPGRRLLNDDHRIGL